MGNAEGCRPDRAWRRERERREDISEADNEVETGIDASEPSSADMDNCCIAGGDGDLGVCSNPSGGAASGFWGGGSVKVDSVGFEPRSHKLNEDISMTEKTLETKISLVVDNTEYI